MMSIHGRSEGMVTAKYYLVVGGPSKTTKEVNEKKNP
jgi:hypothetical protein